MEHLLIGIIPRDMARAIDPYYVEARQKHTYLPKYYAKKSHVKLNDFVMTYDNWSKEFYIARVLRYVKSEFGTSVRVSLGEGREMYLSDCVLLPRTEESKE